MTDEKRPSAWHGVAIAVTFVAVFACALVNLFGDIHTGDPLAPAAALAAVIEAAVLALVAAFGVLMLLGNLSGD